jgi:CRP-like cAMP-binding protein
LPAHDVCKAPGKRRTLIIATKDLALARKANGTFDPKAFLATVDHGRTITKYAKDAIVFAQAGPADSVFYIQKGRIKIVVESEQGKEAVVAILGAGEFFGEGCLIGQPLRLATARAMAESEVMRVGKAEMIRVLHAEPSFGGLFTAHLLTRNSRVEAAASSARGAQPIGEHFQFCAAEEPNHEPFHSHRCRAGAGTRVRMDNGTQLDMLAIDDSQTPLQIDRGRIDIKTFTLDTQTPYQVVTPRGTITLLSDT